MNKTVLATVATLTLSAVASSAITATVYGGYKGLKWIKNNAHTTEIPGVDGKPFANSRYYKEGDYSIHYRIDPSCKTEPVGKIFMIHGFACNTSFYDEMVEIYTRSGFTCVRVDVPGCGFSTRENENIAPIPREDLCFHVMDTVDASGEVPAGKWLLMGHSMGGGIAMNMAYDNPDKFNSVVLYAPMAVVNAPGFVKNIVTLKPLCDFFDSVFIPAGSWDPIMKAVILCMTMDISYTKSFAVRKFSDGLTVPGSGTTMSYMMARARPTLHANMSKVNLPIQLIWGKWDMFNTPGTVKKFQAALNNPAVSVFDKGGHCFIQNMTEEACDSTIDFLKSKGIYNF